MSTLIVPFVALFEIRKLRRAGVPVHRAHEKLGHATAERIHDAPLIWFHAASVGESLSVLGLITQMGRSLHQARFLITSGTATSATLLASRLPPRTVHQFAPLDAPGPMTRFLRRWRPDAAVFVESELWPQMLRRTFGTGAKMALVNARLSKRSVARWRSQPRLADYVLNVFSLIITQNDEMAEAMVSMHAPAPRVARGTNLKSMAGPLPVDDDALFQARASLGHRPVWVASSTHAGEEAAVIEAHVRFLKTHPTGCLILAPRHPERGDEVATLIQAHGLEMRRRTQAHWPGGQVFLADTLGELGLWYALSDVVFLGGSLRPIGGHNPFEVAHAGARILAGPHVAAFAETYQEMQRAGAATTVEDAAALATAVLDHFADPAAAKRAQVAVAGFSRDQSAALQGISDRLIKALDLAP
ncbi:MAG: 3-deoxy-D-manno-octulosonic acid transferase [Pseudomonadota bacterium]